MNSLLVINLSTEPKTLCVVSLAEGQLKVIESQEIVLPEKESSAAEPAPENNANPDSDHGEKSEEPATQDSGTSPEASVPEMHKADMSAAIRTALSKLSSRWHSSAVIFNPDSYYSINIELPFQDDKTVGKIIGTETQDLLSFDLQEFSMDHKVIGKISDINFDIHVAIAGKQELASLLEDCKHVGLDPVAIAPLSALFEGKIQGAPESYSSTCCRICFSHCDATLAFRVNSKIRSDRIIKTAQLPQNEIIAEIKRSVLSVESRYNVTIEDIYVNQLDSPDPASAITSLPVALQNSLPDNKSVRPEQDGENPALSLYRILGDRGEAENLLVNFRSGEFAKVLSFENIWQISKPLLPYLLLAVLMSAAALFGSYMSKEKEIASLEMALSEKVGQVLGEQNTDASQLVKTIQDKNTLIEKQLRELGSPAKFSPLEVLIELVKDFSGKTSVNMLSLSIKGPELVLVGTSASYEAVEAVEKVFAEKKSFYCKFSKQVSGSSTRQFTFNVSLCD